MTAYILGAGASVSAGYPLASRLLQAVSDWLDCCDEAEHWVGWSRNRIVQIRETFGSLDDFEGILGKLEEFGQERTKPTGATTYHQNFQDIAHDCMERLGREDCWDLPELQGFYPQYLRSDLITALRELFYWTEQKRTSPTAYDTFAERRIEPDSTIISLNYDVALERALIKAGKWDIGTGYGFTAFPDRFPSLTKIYKLHGSVNWFQTPMQQNPPPLIFSRDLKVLGYDDLVDQPVGASGVAVNNSGTFILPDPRKKFYWERFWLPLWSSAAERLRGASEVFIQGYSMPPADSLARQLLFDNINKDAAVNVYCRSASDRIAEEFRIRGFTNINSFSTTGFETWAEASP